MTLQRRVLLLLLVTAPLVWAAALAFSLHRARSEINELFDTELIRLARQVQATLPTASLHAIEGPGEAASSAQTTPTRTLANSGEADLETLSIAVWDRQGRLLLSDREGVMLPNRPDASGFTELALRTGQWRAYYLQSASGEWVVAAGQSLHERDELMWGLVGGQLIPWVLTLPVLMLVIVAAVRQALKPVTELASEIGARPASDLRPLNGATLPSDLKPLVRAMNTLFARISTALERERRFTADAAHELRTPLAALQAQWDAAQLDPASGVRDADGKIGQSLARLSRLVAQLLSLSRIDADLGAAGAAGAPGLAGVAAGASPPRLPAPSLPMADWPLLAEQAMSDVLPLAEQRHVELACEWPNDGEPGVHPAAPSRGAEPVPLPLHGDSSLLVAMLRNLLDNAVRHSPPGGQVTLRFGVDSVAVLDEGPGVSAEHLARLGDRFYRPPGQAGVGSGLGLSIVTLIAQAHGLRVDWRNRAGRNGFEVTLTKV
ncbi:quorum sensing histidine kinase QseC [soil metagenome]